MPATAAYVIFGLMIRECIIEKNTAVSHQSKWNIRAAPETLSIHMILADSFPAAEKTTDIAAVIGNIAERERVAKNAIPYITSIPCFIDLNIRKLKVKYLYFLYLFGHLISR